MTTNPDINVGIGTIYEPTKKLHVASLHQSGTPVPSNSGIRIEDDVFTGYFNITESSIWDITTDGDSKKLHFSNPTNTVMTVTETGGVGIGTTDPVAMLEISANSAFSRGLHVPAKSTFAVDGANLSLELLTASGVQIHQATSGNSAPSGGEVALIIGDTSARSMLFAPHLGPGYFSGITQNGDLGIFFRNIGGGEGGGFVIAPHQQPPGNVGIRIGPDGNVGIGTPLSNNSENYMLAVNGIIGAKKIKVEISSNAWSWPDHVFSEDYKMLNWKDKEAFYLKAKHLPGIPSAAEIDKNGLDISNVMSGMTLNVEENRIDITELYKRIEQLEKENKSKELQIKKLHKSRK